MTTDETNGSETDLTLATPKETPPSTPSTIVASLDKSILQVCRLLGYYVDSSCCLDSILRQHNSLYSFFQIRDWLTVLETMLKQQVAIVGDSDDVIQLLEKQKVGI